MRFVNRTKRGTALIETAQTGESHCHFQCEFALNEIHHVIQQPSEADYIEHI